MKNQPFILPLTGLITGILFAESAYFSFESITIRILLFIFLALIIFPSVRKRAYPIWMFIVFSLIGCLLLIGKNNFTALPEDYTNEENYLKLKIDRDFKPSENYFKYRAELLSVDSVNYGNHFILLYWKKENSELYKGDEIWIEAKINPSPKALNPHQFDYSEYLKRQGIRYVIFSDTVFHLTKKGNSFEYLTGKYKKSILKKLEAAGYSKNSTDLIGAMLLGDRAEINPELEESFRKTGVVHILAISGLHVMMVYSIFLVLLFPVLKLKDGKRIRIILSLCLLWGFVVFVGFKPPVLRSSIMISIYHFSVLLRRKPNIYHTLALSAFLLLIINPNYLLDPGFQLSYSAVFFIVWLNPVYQKIFNPKTKLTKSAVAFFGTTVSAQLGTFPFAAYHFNQSSALFLLGNLAMIPASYAMIAGGMLSVFLMMIRLTLTPWIKFFNLLNDMAIGYINWLSSFDFFVFDSISLTVFEAVIIVVIAILLRFIILKPKFKYIFPALLLVLAFEFERGFRNYRLSQKEEIIIFHQNRNTVLGVRYGKRMDVYLREPEDSVNVKKYVLKPYSIQEKTKEINLYGIEEERESFYLKTKDYIIYDNVKFLLLNENIRSSETSFDYILFHNRNKYDWSSVGTESIVIFDGSSYYNSKLDDETIPVWNTRKDGAYIIVPD